LTLSDTIRSLEGGLASFPWLDPHTHIDAAHLSARGLDDILLYHMAVSDLYAGGCPSGARVPEDRSTNEAYRRLDEAVPFLPKVRNTFISWGTRIILEDAMTFHFSIGSNRAVKCRSTGACWVMR